MLQHPDIASLIRATGCADEIKYGIVDEVVAHFNMALAKGETRDGYEVLVSKRCRLCNRPLTREDSIKGELGPVCRAKVGL